ncbi:methionine gamma-lyase [Blattamonas nauphoetae]|uniref:Methionine gamma-lyase n=1 Tax=Blattamonas nauphoetae TaxID=2049346 RepID=A0ABQ9YG79_9EUKA|nr:methionine gamma-lyase [Blattamonas nauphoetae]
MSNKQGFATVAAHADGHDKPMHSHTWPIFQTSSFVFDSPEHGARLFAGEESGHIYSRLGNPTVEAFERVMSQLEEGDRTCAFSSGMATIMHCTMPFLKSGDDMICGDTLYGCTVDLFQEHFPHYNISVTVVDTSDIAQIQAALKPNTKLIFLETPANPTNKITSLKKVSELAHKHGAIVAVDATFASPYFIKPLALGADISMHSLTKYVNGHGDVVGGCLTLKNPDLIQKVLKFRKVHGGILAPLDAFLVLRGVRTLACRMERIQATGRSVATYLRNHPKITRVLYPGFEDAPGHEIVKDEMTGVGGTFSFIMKGGYDAAKKLLEEVKICTVAVSLGSFDTLIEHPASMTHACVSEELMAKQGLTRDLVRISVGLEDDKDIIQDLAQALDKL